MPIHRELPEQKKKKKGTVMANASSRVELSGNFLAPYRAKRDNFLGLLARMIHKGHYSRDGESWTDTIKRCVEGNVNEVPGVSIIEAERLFDVLWNGYALPPGRGLWTGGVPGIPAGARYNCYVCELRSFDDIGWAMRNLMLGGGVGVSLDKISGFEPVKKEPANFNIVCDISHPDYYQTISAQRKVVCEMSDTNMPCVYEVEDTREGWVEAVMLLLSCAFNSRSLTLNLSKIREHGRKLKTFGGVASGPKPLAQLFSNIWNIIRAKRGMRLSSVDWVDIIDWVGVCIQSGNVRRSAIIVLGDIDDHAFRKAKQDQAAVESHRWASNNSIMFKHKEQFDDFDWLKLVYDNDNFGDPGFANMWLARMFDPDVVGVNPCGEQFLHHHEACNLAEVFPGNWPKNIHSDVSFQREIFQLITRYAIRQRMSPLDDLQSEETRLRNMRVGIGIGGLCDFEWNEPLLSEWYRYTRNEANSYADYLGVNRPITTTTIKPSGSISLLTGSNPGIHAPKGKHIIRRVRFNKGDPMIEVLLKAGVPCEPDHYAPNDRVVFAFPIECRIASHTKVSSQETVEDQIMRQLAVQRAWADNAISITVEYNDGEQEALAGILKKYAPQMKSCSFLRKTNMYKQAPLEVIDSDQYFELIRNIDQNAGLNDEFEIDLETCEGGACGIDRVQVLNTSNRVDVDGLQAVIFILCKSIQNRLYSINL